MKRWIWVVGFLTILALLSACASAPAAPPLPTRTPWPTFTSAPVQPLLLPSATDTPFSLATSVPTRTPYPADTAPTATSRVASATAVSTHTPNPTPSAVIPIETPSPTAAAVWPSATPNPTATTVMPTDTPAPTATPAPSPTDTETPTPLAPTDTPVPTPAPPSCPAGYDLHTHGSIVFSACCPTGWAISDYEDAAQGMRGVLFQAPGSNRSSGVGLRTISVQVAPNTTGVSGDEFLNAAALALFRKYGNRLLDHIDTLQVDGRVGVEAAYQRELPCATGTVQVTGWEGVFLVDNQQWAIEVLGRSEYRAELEGIHNEFLSHFVLTH